MRTPTPDPYLLELYGTADLLKQANSTPKSKLPLAVALGSLLTYGALRGSSRENGRQTAQRQQHASDQEAARNAGDVRSLLGGNRLDPYSAQMFQQARAANTAPPPDNGFPLELLDKGAAAYAKQAAQEMAKSASLGGLALKALGGLNRLPNLAVQGAKRAIKPVAQQVPGVGRKSGWKGQALLGAGALGAGALAMKGGKAALEFGSQPAQPYVQGGGASLPRYTNQYGAVTF